MEMVLNNGFVELSMDDMCDIDGGGVWKAVKAFAGCVLVGFSPAIGIGVGIVAGPIAREPLYVYEFQKTNDLLTNMKSSSNSIGIVLDEYGVSVGLISMEDLIEEIIGDIKDEYDDAEHNNIVKIDDTHYSIDGGIKLDDLNDALDLDIESEDYDSIGGYIIQLLDHLPAVGDTASDGVISCKVTKLDKKRVSRVLLEILPQPDTDNDDVNE